ncbi:hypothetical protein LTR62_003110 [Meristemomyces frigidus]|uniref:Paraoxonase n=1 Tax=Meristemomyces frigidus TaxID=1508187 RepID=A0AAN7TJ61_9PEZI|nr:hypothetical protein LTR62_003110 [Meristemomyces frigidus]
MSRISSTAYAAVLALFGVTSTFLYSRWGAYSTFYANRPGALKNFNILPQAGVEFEDIVRNCEDVYMNEVDGWALLSCDPARASWNTVMGTFKNPSSHPDTGLYIYNYQDQDAAIPHKLTLTNFNSSTFHPLGIEYVPQSRTLYVVNHAEAGSRIESFRIKVDNQQAHHLATIEHPDLQTPNSIAALSASSLLVTEDHYFEARYHPWLAKLETYLGLSLGSIVRLDLDITRAAGPPKLTYLAGQAFANGIVLLDAKTMAVASTVGAAVNIYTSPSGFTQDREDVTLKQTINLSFLPDNLSVDSNGALLIAGHPYAPSLEAVAKCSEAKQARDKCPKAPSWIASWTPAGGVQDLFVGSDFGTATTAVRDVGRGIGIAVGLYEKGIMTWSEPGNDGQNVLQQPL